MDEIKIENSLSVMCHGCLSSDRRTMALGALSDVFSNIIGSQKQTMIYSAEDIKFCWECMAILRKIRLFQNQLKKAQNVLMQMLYDLDCIPMMLSKLSISRKDFYDNDYQHIEHRTKEHHEHKEEHILAHTEEETKVNDCIDIDNIDSIKEESHIEYDPYIDDDINKQKDYLTDNKTEINDFTGNYDELNTIIKENKYPNNLITDIHTKKVRAKRRKLVKSRDNSVSYYKQYAALIEREKIDWGKVDNYFTMITFDEAQMEEQFLSKERKFSEFSRFKYKCVTCELGFMRNFDLKRHNNLNHNKKSDFRCSVCHTSQGSLEALQSHWREHTPVAKCNICSDVCRPRGMKNHLNYAHTNKYACHFCNLKFGKILHFSVHYKEMHQNYICDYCNACCKSKTLVQKHIRTHHTKFTCKECNRQYPNYRQYKRHNNELHPNRFKERPELAYCVECDKQYASVTKYKKHLKISPKHTEVKRILLPCPDCGKIFRRKNYLNNHYNLYHAKKSKHYCDLCDKYFANGYGLRKHKTHVHLKVSRVKDKMCDLCGRGFATNRILLNHRRTHTGERPYQCPFCTAAFTQKQAMQSHCRTQHKDIK